MTIVAIDYGLGLSEVLGTVLVQQPMRLRVPNQWRPRLREEHVAQAVGDVLAVTPDDIAAVVNVVPDDWCQAVPRLQKVLAYLLQRQCALDACAREGLNDGTCDS